MKLSLNVNLKVSKNSEINLNEIYLVAAARKDRRAVAIFRGKVGTKRSNYYYSSLIDYDGIILFIKSHKTKREAFFHFHMLVNDD